MSKIVILQSSYIPWRGFFDLIRTADVFVIYDEAQYSKGDWRNRNIIVTQSGTKWITIALRKSGRFGQTIDMVEVANAKWSTDHKNQLENTYRTAPYFEKWREPIFALYDQLRDETRLTVINRSFMEHICRWAHISTPIVDSRDIDGPQGQTERLVGIVRALGGNEYISGPAAKTYLNCELFEEAKISVSWMEYPNYPDYRQLDGQYRATVSILDTLFMHDIKHLFSTSD